MSNSKQKLELTWIGKNNPEYDIANIEPRILEERSDLSYGDSKTENMIIHGDNLLALKALLPEYEGKIKCIYIDPPYNTGSAFKYYDDSVEHSTWLSLMQNRLLLFQALLSDDGSIWINLDDNEAHYCKIMCDEVFGRLNFLCDIAWEKRYSPPSDTKDFGYIHDHILCYRKSSSFRRNLLPLTEDQEGRYKNPDSDPRGPWKAMDYTCRYTAEERPNLYYPILQPNTGEKISPKRTRVWAMSKEVHEKNVREGRIWWGTKGQNSVPALKNFLSEINQGMMPMSLWRYSLAGHNQDARKESMILFPESPFTTPKPEKLIQTILHIATNAGDWVLDSFLGSGTTTAVAHKMKRKYIGIEMGDHAYSHVHKRMKKVVNGKDGLKLSETLEWNGGDGFKFYELAPSFISTDEFGNPVIDSYYNDTKLIRAMCKLTGYSFSPSPKDYWKHGKGQGNNSIYVTTQLLSVAMVQQILSHLGRNETLLICPKKFEPGCEKVDAHITIKKIPQSILKACQYGKKEYLLPIKERPIEEIEAEDSDDEE